MPDLLAFAVFVGEMFAVTFGALFLVLLFAEIASDIQARRRREND